MDISNLIIAKEYPKELKGCGILLMLYPDNLLDGYLEIFGCFGNTLQDSQFDIFTLKNGAKSFTAFQDSFKNLMSKVVESKQLSNDELIALNSQIEITKSELIKMFEMAIEMGLKANVYKLPDIPTR